MNKLILIISLCAVEFSYASPLLSGAAPRIWGGEDAPPNSAPYKAALIMGEPWLSLVCGGSIVSRSQILTAAQCIERVLVGDEMMPAFQAVVGSHQWHTGGTTVNFKAYHIHPQWDSVTNKFDVGVLKLTEDLVWGESVASIGLDYDWVGGDERGFVAGFGLKNGFLLPAYLQLLNVRTLPDIAPPFNPEVELCTYQPIGDGMCMGDIGNGLISLKNNKIMGIASWGFACAFGVPDVFTRVSVVKEFLNLLIED